MQREAYLEPGAGNTQGSAVTRTLCISQDPSTDFDASSGEGWGKLSPSE
jgi:hypothetical protein